MNAKPEASEEREARAAAERILPNHFNLDEDCWYSCPMHPDSCNDGKECNCNLEARRADVEAVYLSGHAAALAKSEQLEALWREYVELLATELNLLVGLAVAHGWQGNQASYEKGVKLRAALGIEPVPSPAQKGEGQP